jgi:HJR/Mrr/RecB family endonuclease
MAVVVQDVLCLAWQDNNIVLALSNIYTIYRAEDFQERQRKHLAKTSTVTKPIQAKGRHSCIVLFNNSKLRRKEEIYSI